MVLQPDTTVVYVSEPEQEKLPKGHKSDGVWATSHTAKKLTGRRVRSSSIVLKATDNVIMYRSSTFPDGYPLTYKSLHQQLKKKI